MGLGCYRGLEGLGIRVQGLGFSTVKGFRGHRAVDPSEFRV